jgi:hypothetical protein
MTVTVSYKGQTIVGWENGRKTLLTSGKYLEDNIVIVETGTSHSSQSKTVAPSLSTTYVVPGSGYDYLSSVTVQAITGPLLANLDSDFNASNIKSGVDMFGITGTYEGSGGGGGATQVTVTINNSNGSVTNLIYPSSASWTGFIPQETGSVSGLLTIQPNTLFLMALLGSSMTVSVPSGYTATKLQINGSRINPYYWIVEVGTSNGTISAG